MKPFEISISVKIDQLSAQPGPRQAPDSEAVVYGILPDQAALDEVMNRLYEISMQIMRANIHSKTTQEFIALAVPQPLHLN